MTFIHFIIDKVNKSFIIDKVNKCQTGWKDLCFLGQLQIKRYIFLIPGA